MLGWKQHHFENGDIPDDVRNNYNNHDNDRDGNDNNNGSNNVNNDNTYDNDSNDDKDNEDDFYDSANNDGQTVAFELIRYWESLMEKIHTFYYVFICMCRVPNMSSGYKLPRKN